MMMMMMMMTMTMVMIKSKLCKCRELTPSGDRAPVNLSYLDGDDDDNHDEVDEVDEVDDADGDDDEEYEDDDDDDDDDDDYNYDDGEDPDDIYNDDGDDDDADDDYNDDSKQTKPGADKQQWRSHTCESWRQTLSCSMITLTMMGQRCVKFFVAEISLLVCFCCYLGGG